MNLSAALLWILRENVHGRNIIVDLRNMPKLAVYRLIVVMYM